MAFAKSAAHTSLMIQGLLKSVGLQSECFETAEQFLQRKPSNGPSCHDIGCEPSRNQRPGFSAATEEGGPPDSNYFRYRTRRYSNDGKGYEVGRGGIFDQTF